MDPLFALLIAMWIAGKFTSNVAQDVAWKARGEDPPSYRRERERWERKQARRAEGDGPAKRLLANAWADACAAGEERRQRIAERAAERRRSKWADEDVDAAEVEAREINDRIDTRPEQVYTCGGCHTEIGQSDVAGYALSGDPLCRACRTGTGTPDDTRRRCHGCRRLFDPADLVTASCDSCPGDGGGSVDACRDCVQATRMHRETADRAWDASEDAAARGPATAPGGHGEQPDQAAEEPEREQPLAPVTDLAEWRSKGATPPITKEDIVSGETTNLSAALTYTQDMANQCGAGAASTETSIATLQAADVSGDVIAQLTRAQEALNQAMVAFNAAHADLTGQLSVKDAYQAHQGAGDKQFVTQD